MEYKGVANYHTDWNMESQFLTSDLHRVMDLDATVNSHPIVQTVENPDQITELFDSITYSKGASVLRYKIKVIIKFFENTKLNITTACISILLNVKCYFLLECWKISWEMKNFE